MPKGVLGPDVFIANAPGPGYQAPDLGVIITYTAVETGSGTVTASCQLEGSNDGTTWFPVGAAIALNGAAPQSGSAVRVQFSFAQYRSNVSGITGTGAQVTTHIAVGS
jgi:hypothetical protein